MQIPVPNNPPVSSKNTSPRIPMHMYSRRKKGKNAGMVKDAHSIHRNEKPCALDGQECPVITSNSGALPERSKAQVLHHVQKVEKVPSHGEQKSHAHAACGSLYNEKPKKVYSRRKAKDAPFKDKERPKEQKLAKAKCALSPDKKQVPDTEVECAVGQYEAKEQKLAKAKCALSPDSKRSRVTEGECALGQYEAIFDQFLKTSDSAELGVVAAVVEGGKYAAVRAGLQASTASSIEKARFKDVLKQPDGLRTYLECRNFILGLWEKDVCRTLSITDYGLSAAASSNESSRIRLFRDIHYFLSYRGFINLGVTSKKPKQNPEGRGGAIPSNFGSVWGIAKADGHSEMEAITHVQDSAEPANVKQPELPKIMSFQKFAKRDHIDVSKRRPLQRETLLLYGKDLVTSGADARHSKVRDWSIDFSDSCSYLGSPRLLAMLDNASSRDGFSAVIPSVPGISSTEIAGERHESGLTSNQDEGALPISKEATDDASAGSSMRDSQRRQSGVCLASLNSGNTPLNTAPSNEGDKLAELLSPNVDAQKLEGSISNHPSLLSADADKRDSQSHSNEKRPDSAEGRCCSLNEANAASAGSSVRLAAGKQIEAQQTVDGSPGQLLPDGGKSYLSTGGLSKSMMLENQNPMSDMSEQVKKAVTDYVAHLLTPLYKTRRISKESFKTIMKKSIAKVMERRTEEELVMDAAEFMDTKRKIKIRSLVDKLVERYLECT